MVCYQLVGFFCDNINNKMFYENEHLPIAAYSVLKSACIICIPVPYPKHMAVFCSMVL